MEACFRFALVSDDDLSGSLATRPDRRVLDCMLASTSGFEGEESPKLESRAGIR